MINSNELFQLPSDVRVSDHALLRYIERVNGIDFDDARRSILTPTVVEAIRAGAKRVRVDGMVYIIKDKTIVTIITAEMAKGHPL